VWRLGPIAVTYDWQALWSDDRARVAGLRLLAALVRKGTGQCQKTCP
jgi:hypothetical protein